MSNQINVGKTQHTRISHDEHQDKPDPQSGLVKEFRGLMAMVGEKDEGDSKSTSKIPESVKTSLSKHGGVCQVGSAEITRRGDMLHYRLMNGPMMGLVIQANYDKKGIKLKLFPNNDRQARALQSVLPKLTENLTGRRHPISLDLMAVRKNA